MWEVGGQAFWLRDVQRSERFRDTVHIFESPMGFGVQNLSWDVDIGGFVIGILNLQSC